MNPLSRREVLRFGAFTTVGGALTPGISSPRPLSPTPRGSPPATFSSAAQGHDPAYDARPEKAGRFPIIVVISGFTGNNEQNKDVVRRFAQAGFYAIAPEPYEREGGMQGRTSPEMGQIAGGVTRAQYLGDIKRRRRLREAAAVGAGRPVGRHRLLRRGGADAPLRRRVPGRRGGGALVRPRKRSTRTPRVWTPQPL